MLKRMVILVALALSVAAPASAEQVEAAFSPGPSAEALVISTIGSARQTVEVAAYVFTSAPVSKALIAAHKRGVLIQVVADAKGSTGQSAIAALNALSLAGIDVRLNGKYAIHHDKYMIIDGRTVQTGSFNYTGAAAKKNSENVIVIKDNPILAKKYRVHWQKRFDEAEPYKVNF